MQRFYHLIIIFLFIVNIAFAQKGKDTVVYNLPVVNNKLIYKDSVKVLNRNADTLASTAKKWFNNYYKYHRLLPQQGKDTSNSLLGQGILEFKVKPGMLNLLFYMVYTIQITCKDNFYSYTISQISFKPHNGIFHATGLDVIAFENNPEEFDSIIQTKAHKFSPVSNHR